MTINGTLVFDGVDLQTLGNLTVVPGDLENAPARQFSTFTPIGRNGDIIIDDQKYANVEMTYWVMIRSNFSTIYRNVRGFLLSRTGYCRLTDSWHPDEYYQAYVVSDIEPTMTRSRDRGAFQVTFSRKPQRFLTSGEQEYTQSTDPDVSELVNPSYFESKPIIKFTPSATGLATEGTGSAFDSFQSFCALYATHGSTYELDTYIGFTLTPGVKLGDYVDSGEVIILDCELQSARTNLGTNLNDIIQFRDAAYERVDVFPSFVAKKRNGIVDLWNMTSAISAVPRWWTV